MREVPAALTRGLAQENQSAGPPRKTVVAPVAPRFVPTIVSVPPAPAERSAGLEEVSTGASKTVHVAVAAGPVPAALVAVTLSVVSFPPDPGGKTYPVATGVARVSTEAPPESEYDCTGREGCGLVTVAEMATSATRGTAVCVHVTVTLRTGGYPAYSGTETETGGTARGKNSASLPDSVTEKTGAASTAEVIVPVKVPMSARFVRDTEALAPVRVGATGSRETVTPWKSAGATVTAREKGSPVIANAALGVSVKERFAT